MLVLTFSNKFQKSIRSSNSVGFSIIIIECNVMTINISVVTLDLQGNFWKTHFKVNDNLIYINENPYTPPGILKQLKNTLQIGCQKHPKQ